jgi:hypothetical protein
MYSRGIPVAITAVLALLVMGAVGRAQAEQHAARATLMPRELDPLRLQGSGFKRRERVRVTVTPTSGDPVAKRVRARRDGSFSVTFKGVESCNGLEGAAVGRRGSRASFQFSALTCPGSSLDG